MTSIKDVAAKAGVSPSTVSYAISGKRPISKKTVERINRAIKTLDYVPDSGAHQLRSHKSSTIAFSTPMRANVSEKRYLRYFLEAAQAAKRKGYDILLLPQDNVIDDLIRVTATNKVDGVLILDVQRDDERIMESHRYRKPSVAIGLPGTQGQTVCIDLNFTAMGTAAADYLRAKGHCSVYFLRALETDYQRQSEYVIQFHDSFMQRARNIGIQVTESGAVDSSTFNPDQFVNTVLLASSRPTALLSQADSTLLRAIIERMQSRRIGIPQRLSILSCGTYFQEDPMPLPITEFPLDPKRLADTAIDMLTDEIENDNAQRGVTLTIAPRVAERGSVRDWAETDSNLIKRNHII